MQYRHDQRGVSENPAEFTAAQAGTLRPRIEKELGNDFYIYTQPVMAEDLIVVTTAIRGKVFAFNPKTGDPAWPTREDLSQPVATDCGGSKLVGFWNSAAIAGDLVYVASPDGKLYALRRSDGTTAWSTVIADGSAAGHGEFVQSSPSVSTALGKLYLGVASSAHCDLIPGRVIAVDLATHAVTRKELLGPGQRGAAVWSSVTVAEDENRIYVSSGNQVGGRAAEPLAQAIVAMDAKTLEVLDHWQNPTALENCDFGSSPTIFNAGGEKLVAATSKDGFLYVLRRNALAQGPLWTFKLAMLDPADLTVGADPVKGYGSISTPVFASGRLYAAGGRTPDDKYAGSVVAFDPATGTPIWTHPTPGYVIAPLAAAGDILAVESSAPDNFSSTLEILDQKTGSVLKSFSSSTATYGAPAIGRGLVVWTDALAHLRVYEAVF